MTATILFALVGILLLIAGATVPERLNAPIVGGILALTYALSTLL
jgi:hypothetical protein